MTTASDDARALVSAIADEAVLEGVVSDVVARLLERSFCLTPEDSEATAHDVGAVLLELARIADVALHTVDDAVGVPRDEARRRLFAKLAES